MEFAFAIPYFNFRHTPLSKVTLCHGYFSTYLTNSINPAIILDKCQEKQTTFLEDLIYALMALPWWGCLIAAVVFWGLGRYFLGRLDPAEMHSGVLAPLVKFGFYGLSILSIIIAPFAALKAHRRRMLLDNQNNIDSIRSLSWREFEQLVGEAYRRQGYEVEMTGGGGADGGIDLILRRSGQTVIVQCKQWKVRQVGVDKVRELFGVVTAERADHGILVSSGTFTREALSFQSGKPMTLIDGPALAKLVQSVQPAKRSPSKAPDPAATVPTKQDPLCPLCESPMILRTARRGSNAGGTFYGCPRYPECKGIRQTYP